MALVEYLQMELARLRSRGQLASKSDDSNKLKQALYSHYYSPFTPITPARNQTSELVNGYMDSEVVYSIINKIADTASSVPLRLYTEDDKEVENHWAIDLLKRPNEDTTLKELIYNYYVYLLSIGNSYIYAPFLSSNRTIEMWTMPSDLVNVISGPFFEPVVGYKLIEGSQEIVFEKPTVMHGKLFNPRFQSGSWVYGLSPIAVASEIISALNAGITATEASFRNMGPPYIISSQTPEGLTPQQQEMLEGTYKKKYGDPNNAGKPMLTGTPVDVKHLGVSPVDLNIISNSEHGLRVMCNVYGVPSVLFNDNASSTYNNVSQARKDFYQFTIMPLNLLLAQKLKQFLIPKEKLKFKFDYSDVEVLQEAFFTRSQAMVNTWFLTPNEKREQLGLNPLDDPLMDEIYKPMGLEKLDEMADLPSLTQETFIDNGKPVRKMVV